MTIRTHRLRFSFPAAVLAGLALACAWGCAKLQTAADAATPVSATSAPAARLDRIVFPKLSFDEIPSGEAFCRIQQLAAEQDPAGGPVGFLLCNPPSAAAAEKVGTAESNHEPGHAMPRPVGNRPVSLNMEQVPLNDAIHYLCMSADLDWRQYGDLVAIESYTLNLRKMTTRIIPMSKEELAWYLDQPVISKTVSALCVDQQPAAADKTAAKPVDTSPERLMKMLESYGVRFPPGSKVSYSESDGLLFVTLPATEQRKVTCVFTTICPDPEQVMVGTRIVRASAAVLAKLGVDPRAAMSDWGKLTVAPEVETLAGGSIVAMSGNEACLESVSKEYFPWEYEIIPITDGIYPEIPTPQITITPDTTDQKSASPPAKTGDGKEITVKLKIEDSRPPLHVIGHSTTPRFGDPTNLGYTMRPIPQVRDNVVINLKGFPEYCGLDGFTAPPYAPVEKMPRVFTLKNETAFELNDGATQCLNRKRITDANGGEAWILTLATARLLNLNGEVMRHDRLRDSDWALPSATPVLSAVDHATPALAARLRTVVACNRGPAGDYPAFLQKLFQENGIALVLPPGGASALPAEVGVYGRFRLGDLLGYYLMSTGLGASEQEGRIFVAKHPVRHWEIQVGSSALTALLMNLSDHNDPYSPDALRAGFPLDPDTKLAYDAATGKLVIDGPEQDVPGQIAALLDAFPSNTKQVEVSLEAVEIPRRELLALAAKNGFAAADALGNGGVLPLRLAELVRCSPKARIVTSLSGMAMSGNESTVEDLHKEYFPTEWEPVQQSSADNGGIETVPESPRFGDPTNIGTILRFIPQVRDQSIIHLKLGLEKTAFEGWRESFGCIELNGKVGPQSRAYMPGIASLTVETELELTDGATVQLARVQGRKLAGSKSQSFFGPDNIFKPGAKLGEERDLFLFITARLLNPDGTPAGK